MKQTALTPLEKTQRVLFVITAVMIAAVLGMALQSHSNVVRSRTVGTCAAVDDVVTTQLNGQSECRFTLGDINHADLLTFYINHHEIQVSIGGTQVYALTASQDDVFVTAGGTWVMIPLHESDAGKEVRVRLTPLYKQYETSTPEFLLGSESAIYQVTLRRAIPALILSLCVVFAGVLLLCLAIYHSVKGMSGGRLYALSLMATSAGLWRITYDRVAFLLLADHAAAVYIVSLLALMLVALSMLNSLKVEGNGKKIIRLFSVGYCVVYILQLALQITGIADLRQTLKVIHITILISAILVAGGARQWHRPEAERDGQRNYGWLLGIGVIVDLLLYYFANTSFNMVFTLVMILCYSVLEGIQLLFAYVEQKKVLEEMETRLTLSRTTTMMSQIRSHFVFNVLNAISGMCKYNPEMADETVVRFARYLRSNIDLMENDQNIPFATDLRQLEDYVALEQVRFGDKIEFYTDIEAENFMIPPLILQPVVENAIKHGVSKKQGNGTIILRTRDAGGHITITVEDDGVGFDRAELDKEHSVGLRNIRFRLEHLVHGTMDIQSEVGKGTTVTLTIPKEDK